MDIKISRTISFAKYRKYFRVLKTAISKAENCASETGFTQANFITRINTIATNGNVI